MDGGLIADTRSEMVPPNAWTDLVNFDFGKAASEQHGVACSVQNWQTPSWTTPAVCGPQFALAINVLGASTRTPTLYRWYWGPVYGGVNVRFGQQLAGVDTNVTPGGYPGVVAGRFSGGLLNNFVPFVNHQTAPPYFWDYLLASWQVLPNLPAVTCTFNALRAYREFLVGLGRLDTAGGGYRSDVVHWSDASLYNMPPPTWIPAAGNQAGEAIVPGGGEIVDGATLGQDFIIYKGDSSYRMTYTGGNYVMAVRPLFKGFGAHSQNCVVELGGKHYVFTGRDLIVHDGQRWESILTGKARSKIDIGSTTPENCFLALNKTTRQLVLGMVQQSDTYADVALVIDTDNGYVGYREIPTLASIVMDQQNQNAFIGTYVGSGAAASGRFFNLNLHESGINHTAQLVRKHLDFGDPAKVKIVKWVRPHVRGANTYPVSVEVAATMNTDDTLTYGTPVIFTNTTSDKADVFAEGRWLSFRFSTAANEDAYSISGFEVGYEERGAF